MKKFLWVFIAFFAVTNINAQDITDALRYSTEELSGTARFRAMSGAFGALGGDMSAIGINPAGSAVFLNSFGTLTLDQRTVENEIGYFNGLGNNKSEDFNFSQAGAVFVFNRNGSANAWNKFTFGVNYSKTNNFDDNFIATGISPNSIDEYFLGYANGVPLEFLETMDDESITDLYSYLGEEKDFGAQQAMLGYQSYIINADNNDPQNTSYTSAIAPGNFNQRYSYAATGLNGKFSFNFAGEYQDFLYLGANLNTHFLNYDRSTRFLETNSNPGSEINEVYFAESLNTTGNGFSLQLGAITKLSDYFRLGASYESPTWYTISEQTTQYLETNNDFNESVVLDPNVINIYPNYNLKTPSKLTGSAALVFGAKGLISVDYVYKDYTNTEFRPVDDPDFEIQNANIVDNLKAASSIRLGGEYRIQNFSLRAGYRMEESPYLDEFTVGELIGYSGGLGYDFGNLKLDLSYDKVDFDENRQLYQVGLTNAANINRDISSLVLSISFGL